MPRAHQIGLWFAPRTGPLRVAADPTYGRILLAPLVPRFMESFPDIPLEVNLQPQGAGMGTGSGKDSDVAIRTGSGEEPGMTHRLLGSPARDLVCDAGVPCSVAARPSGRMTCGRTTS